MSPSATRSLERNPVLSALAALPGDWARRNSSRGTANLLNLANGIAMVAIIAAAVALGVAHVLVVSDQDRATLDSWTRSSTVFAGQRERAEIVVAVAGGAGVSGTARTLGVSRPTVIKCRDRFAVDGVAGLADLPRSGRPKTIDDAQIIAATLDPPPAWLGVTHLSSRLSGRHLGISDATVARAWRAYRVQPWRSETFSFSTDPEPVAKVRDVVGLYLAPTNTRTSTDGWPRTRGSPCTSPQPQLLAEPRRGVLLDHHPPSDPPRIL